jgi:hypothetical protein
MFRNRKHLVLLVVLFTLTGCKLAQSFSTPTRSPEQAAQTALVAVSETLTAMPTPLAGELPFMFMYPQEGSCPEDKVLMNDRISHLYFCLKWIAYDGLAHFYKIEGIDYSLVLHPAEGNNPQYLTLVTPSGTQNLLPDAGAQEIYLLNNDGSHWAGPIYFIIIDGKLYLDEQFKDVVRPAAKGGLNP